MRSLAGPLCGEIERTADQIAAGTADPAAQLAAAVLVFLGLGAVAILVLVRKLFFTPAIDSGPGSS
jgi:hypothetical protein